MEYKKSKVQRIIFFDTETNGLPKSYKESPNNFNNYPEIVQLSAAIYKVEGSYLTEIDHIIKPNGFIINESSEIHGITNELANENGVPISVALQSFLNFFKSGFESEQVVLCAHNYSYDSKVLNAELIRQGKKFNNWNLLEFFSENEMLKGCRKICTMETTTNLLKLPGKYGSYKFPKLQELHNYLFGYEFENAHNSKSDVHATAKCFFELVKNKIITI